MSTRRPLYHRNLTIVFLLAAIRLTHGAAHHTPRDLIDAIKTADFDQVPFLLHAKSDVNAQDKDHKTALVHATWAGNEQCVALLLEAKANIEIPDDLGCTAAHHAASANPTPQSLAILRTLIIAGANIDHENTLGKTVWEAAASQEVQRCIALTLHEQEQENEQNKSRERLLVFDDADEGVILAKVPNVFPVYRPDTSMKKNTQLQARERIVAHAQVNAEDAEIQEALKSFTYGAVDQEIEDDWQEIRYND